MEDSSEDIPDPQDLLNRTCPICQKLYSGKSQLYRHLREVHHENKKLCNRIDEKTRYTFKCLEGCDYSFRFNRDLREHLTTIHQFAIVEKSKEFSCIEDFNHWFFELQESGGHFIKHHGNSKRQNYGVKITYYACSRSGIPRSKIISRKRKPKKYGSKKINAGCTAYIKLEEHNDKCIVNYCNFHYGHKIELEHLPLTFRARAEIVDKLQKGAQIVRLKLENGGNYIGLDNLKRSKVLTVADIKNLKYFSKKEANTTPPIRLKNLNELHPKQTTICENEHFEVITIISSDTNESEEHEMFCEIKNESVEFLPEEVDNALEEDEAGNLTETIDENMVEYYEGASEENEFGQYVAGMLQQIDVSERELAKEKIDEILKRFVGNKA